MTAAPPSTAPPAAAAPREGLPHAVVLPRPRVDVPRRRTVAGRLLASYLLVLMAFAITVGWSFQALRAAARDAELLRAGYVPLLLRIGEALAEQNLFNAQLNDVTASKNPNAVREWLETSRRTRPITFAHLREAADRGFSAAADPTTQTLREDTVREASSIEKMLGEGADRYTQLFQALGAGDLEAANRARDELVKREAEAALRLRAIKARVEDNMDRLTADGKRREARSMQLLVGLALLTLLVGVVTSLYARRVLAPLSVMTARANAVARGDLTPHDVVATNDEIGELATTFEGMVAAIQRARSELVLAERLAAIGKMAAHVTHEIRNPLSSIGLNIELLEDEIHEHFAEKEPALLLGAIKAEVDRLSRVAEQYLSIARRPRPEFESERIDDLVSELCSFVRPELDRASVKLHLDLGCILLEIAVDEAQLRQALLNLIRNAREAMASGGDLAVSVARAAGGGVDIAIDDNGPGIPEELCASIFDPFFTTKQRGTGLGLAITREIVEAHAGAIVCEPRPQGGTRFLIHLPEPETSP